MLTLLSEGFLAGLLISMPMGAIGMLCLRYILIQGNKSGAAAGLGIALADAFAAFIASFGLSSITTFIKDYQLWLQILGSLILIGFGLFFLLQNKTDVKEKIERGLFHILILMFIITITNPLTLLSFTGVFAAIGIDTLMASHLGTSIILSFGVFLGSMSWWIALIFGVDFFKINEQSARRINEIAGVLLILMGLFSLFTAFFN